MRSVAKLTERWGVSKEPLVSICCITYNHERYIAQALDSFFMQETDFPFEIVIHDDASTDNTANIIRKYEKQYPGIINPIYQTENQKSKYKSGMNPRFNYPRAKGKYIALCDGDDYWIDPLKLQKQVDFLNNHKEFSMCFHNALVKYDFERKSLLFKNLREREYFGKEFIKEWIIPTSSVVFRYSYIDKDKLCNPGFLYGDIILFLCLAEKGRIWCLEKAMSVYRRHIGGVSFGSNSIERLEAYIMHYKTIGENFSGEYKKEINEVLGRAYVQVFLKQFKRMEIKNGILSLVNSIAHDKFALFTFILFKLRHRRLK